MKNYNLIPRITLWVLMLVGIAFSILFFAGGSEGSLEVAGDFLNIPRYTDAFLVWGYVLFGLAILATLVAVVASFVSTFKADKKAALKQLGVLVVFAGVLLLAWFLGTPEKLEIIGYEGTDNVGAWAQLADAILYSVYILLGVTLCTLVWGAIYSRVKK